MSKNRLQSRALWDELPPRQEIEKLMGQLDEAGLREFQTEVLDAIYASGHDPRFVKILSAWHRSLRFLTSPGFRDKLSRLAPARGGS